ncbi:MAG: glycosyltransferase [Phycisphaerae bacterium]|nr:glycosyltransferase family 2 protein [Phycisphaerae bacterium]NIP54676.1 glycosyltransferase family 2 protein [Phycisphaerae bacterium]NIS53545.1 glycosyltransferase family 2 protein [Phycisphaerae bacterium]NIU11005.1 glycosyltransferase family 2 protein [Phycisphaerae bacterium]NIU58888.1 glycosyltransferase [Phycisphaerae bacterium]
MAEADLPMVSVIAPCRNEVLFIEKAIRTILENDYPTELIELLVIDGMSTDGTREIVGRMAEHDERIRLLDNPKKIVPSAMNIGIKASQGEYILRIDCHSTFASNYISKCIELSRRTCADNVGGYIITLPGADTRIAKAIMAATSSKFGVGNSTFRLSGPEQEAETVPFGTFRRNLFDKIGLYDERLVRNQDIELNSRIRKAGGRIVISPDIRVNYYNRATYSGLWRQSFNNGLWNPYTIWLTGGGLALRHFIPMFFVIGLFTLSLCAVFQPPVKWVLLGYILVYLCSAGFFSIKHTRRNKILSILVLWSYIVLHISYGFGSLCGLITIPLKFPCRDKNISNEGPVEGTA